MTRDELMEVLSVERFIPLPPAPERAPREPEPVVIDDSEVAVARRRRVLLDALDGYDTHDMSEEGAA